MTTKTNSRRISVLVTPVVWALTATRAQAGCQGIAAPPAAAAAAQSADAGISACASNSGKALYDCIANVLDRLSGDVTVPSAQSALRTAASRLRAAATKAQALSAIAQCRAAISSAISLARTIGRGGATGLGAIAGVLSHAAQLIQSKG
jgi:hypothetical protein